MTVDRNEKIWNWANTGRLVHAFVQAGPTGYLRAMCRESIVRNVDSTFLGLKENEPWACKRCLKLATATWDRAEASMQPATEAHDLGYDAPVDEAHAEVVETQQPDWDALHAEALAVDASGEDQLTISHREAMGSFDGLKPGDVFHKTARRYADSRWVDAPIIVTVLELTQIKDIWSGKTGLGVRFDMHDGLDGRTSIHQLLLQDFQAHWVK